MKIIIDQNSIDLKLTNDDLLHLRDHGYVKSESEFPTQKLIIYVEVKDNQDLRADFTEAGIIVYLPADYLEQLKSSFKIGFKSRFRSLDITLEKILPQKLKS